MEAAEIEDRIGQLAEASLRLAQLRSEGWMVAIHNDYRINGEAMTFWLFTHPDGRWVKGEGKTDAEAVTSAALAGPAPSAAPEAPTEAEWERYGAEFREAMAAPAPPPSGGEATEPERCMIHVGELRCRLRHGHLDGHEFTVKPKASGGDAPTCEPWCRTYKPSGAGVRLGRSDVAYCRVACAEKGAPSKPAIPAPPPERDWGRELRDALELELRLAGAPDSAVGWQTIRAYDQAHAAHPGTGET